MAVKFTTLAAVTRRRQRTAAGDKTKAESQAAKEVRKGGV